MSRDVPHFIKTRREPSPKPKSIRGFKDTAWWYEDRGGILIVHEIRDATGSFVRTDQFRIPWSQLEAAHKRCRGER